MTDMTDITSGPPIPLDVGLVIHGAASHQEDDFSNFQGGVRDLSVKLFDLNLTAHTKVELSSSNVSDNSQVYSVEGISQENIIIIEQIELNGVNQISTTDSFIKLYSVTKLSGSPLNGTVTITSPDVSALGTMPGLSDSVFSVEVTQLRSLLARATPNPTKDKIFYEKFFISNGTLEVINTLIIEEFTDSKNCSTLAFDLDFNEDSLSTNRLVRPKDIPIEDWFKLPRTINDLQPGDSIGVWLQVFVPSGSLLVDKPYVIKLMVDGDISYITLLQPKASARTLEVISNTRYDHPIGGGNPNRFIELVGGRFVPLMFYQPDPNTFRDEFYYNARLNRLFKKINSKPNPVWKIVR